MGDGFSFFVAINNINCERDITMNDTKDFNYEVVKHIGNISKKDNYSKEVNLISWNGRPPVIDIRGWRIGNDESRYPLKGMSMSKSDLIALKDLLQNVDLGG